MYITLNVLVKNILRDGCLAGSGVSKRVHAFNDTYIESNMSSLRASGCNISKQGQLLPHTDRSASIRFRFFILRLARSALYRPTDRDDLYDSNIMYFEWIVKDHITKTKTENINKMNFDSKRFSQDSTLSKIDECDSGFSDG